LLSSEDLKLGKAKELKEKVKTIEDFQKLISRHNTALALVQDGMRNTSYSDDKKGHIVFQVSQEKNDFVMAQM
jgi:hypothetical protein